MPDIGRISIIAAIGIGAFALLLLIISVGTVTWFDDGNGNTVGLFRNCFGSNYSSGVFGPGCYNNNQVTQGGLSVFGLLLLSFGIFGLVANIFLKREIILFASLVQFYFASMFVMAAYATWGVYARDPSLYFFW